MLYPYVWEFLMPEFSLAVWRIFPDEMGNF